MRVALGRAIPLAATLLATAAPQPAAAQAWLRWDLAPRAMGMGGAAGALDDGPSATFFDPAGIAFLIGTHAAAGGAVSAGSGGLDAFGVGEFDRRIDYGADIHVYLTHPVARDLVGGLAVNSPWAFAVAWEDPAGFVGRFRSFDAELASLSVSPVLAWRARPELGVAAGIHVISGVLELGRFAHDPDLSALGGFGPIPLARAESDLDGVGMGWVVGVHWRPSPQVALGAQARGGVGLDLNGPTDFTDVAPPELRAFRPRGSDRTIGEILDARFVDGNSRATLELPALVSAGAAWEPFDRVRLAGTVQWAGWGAADTLAVAFADTALLERTPLDYSDAWALRLGAEIRHRPGLVVRLGYAHEESPAPRRGVGPLLPDADRDAVSAGLGVLWAGMHVDVAYRVAFLEDREGVVFPGSGSFDGVYEGVEHRLAAGVSRNF